MEKETERGTYVLKEDEKLGAVQIADDVVAMIASLAAAEVEAYLLWLEILQTS